MLDTKADTPVRIYKSTHKRLKVRAAQLGWTLAQVIDYAESTMSYDYLKTSEVKRGASLTTNGTKNGLSRRLV